MFYRILDKPYIVFQMSSKIHNITIWFFCYHLKELQNNNDNNNVYMEIDFPIWNWLHE